MSQGACVVGGERNGFMNSQFPGGLCDGSMSTYRYLHCYKMPPLIIACCCVNRNSPALDHEFIHGLGAAGGRGETVPTVHLFHCL